MGTRSRPRGRSARRGSRSTTTSADVVLGAGLYETVRVEAGRIRFGRAHLARLVASATALGLPAPGERAFVHAVASASGGSVVRVTLHAGAGGEAVLAAEARAAQPSSAVRLMTLNGWYAPGYLLREHKLTSHFHGVWARRLAVARGFDDALLLARDGRVGEASNANVAMLESGVLVTPPIDGLLPGVMRDALIRAANSCGLVVHERHLAVAQLVASDGALLTSAPRGPYAIDAIDDTPLRAAPPELLARLRTEVDDLAAARSLPLP